MISDWLKQHSAAEKSFGRALRQHFAEQADRIAEAAENFPGLTPEAVAAIFSADDEHQQLMPLVIRNTGRLMIQGAIDEYEALGQRLSPSKSKVAEEIQAVLQEHLDAVPPRTRDRIRQHLQELAEQDYWRAIQSTVSDDLAGIIRQGIEAGSTPWQIAKAIRDQLGGFEARKRAMVIARTETTGSLNAGHVAAMEDLAEAQLLKGKQWLAIADDDVRQSHLDNDATTVQVAEAFNVGGFDAPHPGHWSLPARERVNCRCVVVGVVL